MLSVAWITTAVTDGGQGSEVLFMKKGGEHLIEISRTLFPARNGGDSCRRIVNAWISKNFQLFELQ